MIAPLILFLIFSSVDTAKADAWAGAYKAKNGSIWSDILPGGGYSNCISKKDSAGKPIPGQEGAKRCETAPSQYLLGDSVDRSTVIDSDAVQACKAIGGELPTTDDFDALGDERDNLPHFNDANTWTASIAPVTLSDLFAYIGPGDSFNYFGGGVFRYEEVSVRCVLRPGAVVHNADK